MVDVVDYETKPIPVKAVQFSGEEGCAKEIIDWVFENSGSGTWATKYGASGDLGGIPELLEDTNLYIVNSGPVEEGSWVVLDREGNFKILSNEAFTEKYIPVNPVEEDYLLLPEAAPIEAL